MADTSIDTLTLDIVVNNTNATRRINSVTKSITKLNQAISNSKLDTFLGTMNGVSSSGTSSKSTSTKSSSKSSSKSSGINTKSLNLFTTLGRLNYYINMFKYYEQSLAKMVQYAIDYNETQNLWQVANRENIALASEFIDKMNEAYGISEQALMNYQAIFKNMLSALGGLSDQLSTKLSQNLTQMALDFSSLYNVSIESAMQKFQAVLSGQVRPIRSVSGYDITETTIFDIYQKAGGEKTMRQLSQLEKRLLRIYAVFQQMESTGATGDLSKTIESAANQSRIMSEQLKETLTWVGQMILFTMNEIELLQKINALLIATKTLAKSLAIEMGYVSEDWSIVSIFEEANEEVDELTGKLLSFDKFNALNPSDDDSSIIDSSIEDLINSIDIKMADVSMKAKEIADSWLETLGVGQKMYMVLYENGETVKMTAKEYDNLDESIKSTIKSVEDYRDISGFLDKISTWAKESGLMDFIETLVVIEKEAFPIMKDFFKELLPVISQILSIVSPIILSVVKILTPVLKIISTILKGLMPIINVILTVVEFIANVVAIIVDFFAEMLGMSWDDWKKVFEVVAEIIDHIGETISWIIDKVKKVGNFFGKIFSWIGDVTIGGYSVSGYASGGYPDQGQLFIANEAGAELVGNIGGRTAVANNDMIVQAIEQAAYKGIVAGLSSNGGMNNVNFSFRDVNSNEMARALAQPMAKELQRQGYRVVKA